MEQITEFIGNNTFLVVAWIGLAIALLLSEFGGKFRSFQEVSPQQAIQLMNREDALVVDTRAHTEYSAGHITGAKQLDLSKVEAVSPLFKGMQEKPVIFYCKSGISSQQAAARLGKAEYKRVYSLKGGITGWVSDQLPVQKS